MNPGSWNSSTQEEGRGGSVTARFLQESRETCALEAHRPSAAWFLQAIPLPQSLSTANARTPTAATVGMSGSIPLSHRNGWETLLLKDGSFPGSAGEGRCV